MRFRVRAGIVLQVSPPLSLLLWRVSRHSPKMWLLDIVILLALFWLCVALDQTNRVWRFAAVTISILITANYCWGAMVNLLAWWTQ